MIQCNIVPVPQGKLDEIVRLRTNPAFTDAMRILDARTAKAQLDAADLAIKILAETDGLRSEAAAKAEEVLFLMKARELILEIFSGQQDVCWTVEIKNVPPE